MAKLIKIVENMKIQEKKIYKKLVNEFNNLDYLELKDKYRVLLEACINVII